MKILEEKLEKVECDNKNCNEKGRYKLCETDYINCPIYKSWKSFIDATSKG